MDSPASVADERVLVLTPTGKDGQLTSEILTRAGFSCRACRRPEELEYEMAAGVGVAILAEEALTSTFMTQLVRMLHTQPPWSDLPLVVFTQHNEGIEILLNMLGRLGNVTVLERPVRITTLLSAVRSGLRGRRRQYELRDLLERLEEADRRKDDFLAMLGHELRNPLAAIQNALNVLTYSASPDPQRRKQHAIIDRQICHLCRIVDDLLDVTRITKGKVVLKREVVDLREIVDRSVQTLTSSEKSERHSVTVIKSAGNLTISGDPVRLEQIVGNLLSNAAKYTPEGGTIELRLTREGSDAVFRVADNGVGIPEEMLPRIFEPLTTRMALPIASSNRFGFWSSKTMTTAAKRCRSCCSSWATKSTSPATVSRGSKKHSLESHISRSSTSGFLAATVTKSRDAFDVSARGSLRGWWR